MTYRSIRLIAIMGALVIAGIIGYQTIWLAKTFSSEAQAFHQTTQVALYNVAEAIAKYNGSTLPSSENLIKRVSSNYYVVNINDVIDAAVLEYYLKKELYSRSLNADFEYAIYDCLNDEMIYGDFCQYDANSDPSNLKLGDLPKYDEFIYYFGVRFPGRPEYLLRGMSSVIVFIVITLLAIGFYTYSLVVMLKQKRLSDLQKDFINNMTHEFKTPISSIRIAAEVLASHASIQQNSRLNQYTHIIKNQNERLNEQVLKVLQLAKLEKENVLLQKEQIDLHQLLSEVMEQVQLQLQPRKGKIQPLFNATTNTILADRHHLSNILYNLFDNSIQYCHQNPFIKVITKDDNQFVELVVKDNGIGIAREHLEHIFEKFYRVPTGNVHNARGFGLGLFYTKAICDAHGWKIDLRSSEHQGTEIHIWIKKAA